MIASAEGCVVFDDCVVGPPVIGDVVEIDTRYDDGDRDTDTVGCVV